MKPRITISFLAFIMLAVPAFGGGIVTLDLLSPSSGVNYRGGGPTEVEWTITAIVSPGDNMGLALVSVDLVQDLYNPIPVELTPAEAVPPEMLGFDRPAGISNPDNGYIGTQVDLWFGAKDVVQIGGAQNTFGGLPDPPVGAMPTGQPPPNLLPAVGWSGRPVASVARCACGTRCMPR